MSAYVPELLQTLRGISTRDPKQRKLDIEKIKTLLRVVQDQELIQVIAAINVPADLRFLIVSGIKGIPKGLLDFKLTNMAAKGII